MKKKIKKQAARLFGADFDNLSPLEGGHVSHVYEFPVGEETFVLRVMPPGEDIDYRNLSGTLEWMHFLSEKGAPSARPLLSTNGLLIESIEFEGQQYLASALIKADGVLGEGLPFDAWNDDMVLSLGRAVGSIHRIAMAYDPPRGEKKFSWDRVQSNYQPVPMQESEMEIVSMSEKYTHMAKALPVTSENYGLIHMDLHGGNFFADTETRKITLFDFDDCAYGWYAMDIAMSLFDMLILYSGEDRKDFAEWYLAAFLEGYYMEKEIAAVDLEQIPVFMKLLECGVYSQVIEYFTEETTHPWSVNFMHSRRENILSDRPYVDLDFGKFARS